MNAERLVTIVHVLSGEIATVRVLEALVTQVQQAINAPNEANQRQAQTTLTGLRDTLSKASSNQLSPGLRADITSLKVSGVTADKLVGQGLADRLVETLQKGYSSVETLDQLRKVAEEVKALASAVQQVNTGLSGLGLKGEELSPGESVVGIEIPRAKVSGVPDLRRELDFFGRFVGQVTEVLTGEHDQSAVYSLHSSPFLGLDLMTSLEVAARIASIIAGIKLVLDTLGGYRDLKEKAEQLGVEQETLDRLTAQSKAKMATSWTKSRPRSFRSARLARPAE